MSLEDLLFLGVFVVIALVNGLRARRAARRSRGPSQGPEAPGPSQIAPATAAGRAPDVPLERLPHAGRPPGSPTPEPSPPTGSDLSSDWGPPPSESIVMRHREPGTGNARERHRRRSPLRPRLTPRSARDAIVLSTILGPCRARDDQSA